MTGRFLFGRKADALRDKTTPEVLTEESFTEGLQYLAGRDASLARILAEFGPPPTWFREPGFPTLIHIILEQQVSLASARAVCKDFRASKCRWSLRHQPKKLLNVNLR